MIIEYFDIFIKDEIYKNQKNTVYGNRAYTSIKKGFLEKIKILIFKFCYNKPKQRIFTTWHRTTLKCIRLGQVGNTVYDFVCGNIEMILGNQFTADIMSHLTFDKIPIKVLGTPQMTFCLHLIKNIIILKKK